MTRAFKVVDAHAHLGGRCVFGITTTEEELVRRMEESGIDATILQPYPGREGRARSSRPSGSLLRAR